MIKRPYVGLLNIANEKDWAKVFKVEKNDKLLKQIQRVFNSHFRRYSRNLNETRMYHDILKTHNLVAYPETGQWDDTMGISPKQIKKFLDKNSITLLLYALDKVQREFDNLDINTKNEYRDYSEDYNVYFYDFNEYWKTFKFESKDLTKYKKDRKTRIKKELEEAAIRAEQERIRKERMDFEKELERVVNAKSIFETLENKVKEEIYETYKKTKKLDTGKIFELNKKLWKDTHNFVPQINDMLVVDPKKWDKNSFLGSLQKLHGVKQLSKIDNIQEFIQMYLTFGNDLIDIPFHLLSSKKNNFFFNNYDLNKEGTNEAFSKIVKNMSKGIIPDMSLTDLSVLNFILSSNSKLTDTFAKKENITQKDLDQLININEHLSKVKTAGYIHLLPYLMERSKSDLDTLFRLNYKEILRLLDQNKDNPQDIPVISTKVKDYDFEIIDKKDVRGYTCGNDFCCQYIGGAGSQFTRYGAKERNSSFLIVSKKGVIIAQSWIWIKNNQLTFDSIEMKSNVSHSVLKDGYEDIAKDLLDLLPDIEIITAGNNRGIFKTNLNKFEKMNGLDCYDSQNQYEVLKRK